MATGPATDDTTTIKKIEGRIYVDLWRMEDTVDETTVYDTTRKLTIGFLKKEGTNVYASYGHLEKKPDFQYPLNAVLLVVTINTNDAVRRAYIEGVASGYPFTSEFSRWRHAYIPLDKMPPDYMVECTLHVICTQEDMSGEGEIEIVAQLFQIRYGGYQEIGNKTQMKMTLCRCPTATNAADPFESLRSQGKDIDIFVMPRVCQEEKHEAYLRKLQLYSNQVLARHKGIQQVQNGRFGFVKEDGIYTPQLGKNYGMSIRTFQGTRKPDQPPQGEFCVNLDYDFSTFGQMRSLVDYIVSNYGMNEQTVREIVIDRNFIYGQKRQQTTVSTSQEIKNIQGIKNIHDKIVRPFRERFILHAQQYVDFPHRWMPKPNLRHYRRGKLTVINNNISLQVCNQNGVMVQVGNVAAGTPLPNVTEITFKKEADGNCDISGGTNRYEIESVVVNGDTVPKGNNRWFVPLTYDAKKLCRDDIEWDDIGDTDNPRNFSTFIGQLPADRAVQRDIAPLDYYRSHNGVPYYISELPPIITGGKNGYDDFLARLDISAIQNWYSYDDRDANANTLPSKPNLPKYPASNRLEGIGLDCSGLIWKCLLNTTYSDAIRETFLSTSTNDNNSEFRLEGENVLKIKENRVRPIPLDDEYKDEDDLLVQAGDLIYSIDADGSRHIAIALCTANANEVTNLDMHLTEVRKNEKYFTIIHNYGGESIKLQDGNMWGEGNGFFRRTLKGPFQHWGPELDNQAGKEHSYVGRVYIWYE
jgi:hypothetical protein